MPKTRIHIVSLAVIDHKVLEQIREAVSQTFAVPVKIREGHLDLTSYLDPTRKQYQADEILEAFSQQYGNHEK